MPRSSRTTPRYKSKGRARARPAWRYEIAPRNEKGGSETRPYDTELKPAHADWLPTVNCQRGARCNHESKIEDFRGEKAKRARGWRARSYSAVDRQLWTVDGRLWGRVLGAGP